MLDICSVVELQQCILEASLYPHLTTIPPLRGGSSQSPIGHACLVIILMTLRSIFMYDYNLLWRHNCGYLYSEERTTGGFLRMATEKPPCVINKSIEGCCAKCPTCRATRITSRKDLRKDQLLLEDIVSEKMLPYYLVYCSSVLVKYSFVLY